MTLNCLKRAGLIVARVSGVMALWEEVGAEATLLLSARWLVASTAGWVWYSACADDWPEGAAITVASDTLGAILGTAAVGTLSMEVIVVLVKLIMDGKRERDRKREAAKDKRIRQLEKSLRENNIEIPPDHATLAESTEPAE